MAGTCRGLTAVPGRLRTGLAPPRGRSPAGKCIPSARKLRTASAQPRLPPSRRRQRAEATGAPPTWTAPHGSAQGEPERWRSAREGRWEAGAQSRCGAARRWRGSGPALGGGGDLRGSSCPASAGARAPLKVDNPPAGDTGGTQSQRRPRPRSSWLSSFKPRFPRQRPRAGGDAPPARGPRRPPRQPGSRPRPPPAPRAPAAVARADLARPRRSPSKHSP